MFFTRITHIIASLGLAIGLLSLVPAILIPMGIWQPDPTNLGPRPSIDFIVTSIIACLGLGTLSEISKAIHRKASDR